MTRWPRPLRHRAHHRRTRHPGTRARTGATRCLHSGARGGRCAGDAAPVRQRPSRLHVHFFIGLSHRTNEAGADQLARWLGRLGYSSSTIALTNDPALLHLKSGLVWLGDRQLLAVPSLAAHPALPAYDVLAVPREEMYAANWVQTDHIGNTLDRGHR